MSIRYDYPNYHLGFFLKWKLHLFRAFVAQERIRRGFDVKSRLRRIQKLNSEFIGPALVIANGPSLNSIDLNALNYFSNLNSIFTINDYYASEKDVINSSYHLMCDRGYWSNEPHKAAYRKQLSQAQQGHNLVIVQPDHMPDYLTGSTLYIRKNPLPTFTQSISIDKVSGLPNNTAFFAIATALYLGYSPVYVVGLDLNYYKFVQFTPGLGWRLRTHHHYDSSPSLYEWQHRDTLSKILNYNLFLISQLSLFKDKNVIIVSDEVVNNSVTNTSIETFNRSFAIG